MTRPGCCREQIFKCWSTARLHGHFHWTHCNDVIMNTMESQITGVSIVCSTVGSGTDQTKHQNSASLAFFTGYSRVTGEFSAQSASNTENVSILMTSSCHLVQCDCRWHYERNICKFVLINVLGLTDYRQDIYRYNEDQVYARSYKRAQQWQFKHDCREGSKDNCYKHH